MIATFYTCNDDPRKVDKTLSQVKAKPVAIYNGCNIITPIMYLDYDAELLNCNYMSLDEWNRYYFIRNFSVDNGKRLYISAELDDLYTYRDQIKACTATAIRNESVGINYVPDPSLPLMPAKNHITSTVIGQYWKTTVVEQARHYVLATK